MFLLSYQNTKLKKKNQIVPNTRKECLKTAQKMVLHMFVCVFVVLSFSLFIYFAFCICFCLRLSVKSTVSLLEAARHGRKQCMEMYANISFF